MTTVDCGSTDDRLSAFDPGLAFLASQAAFELDNVLNGCGCEFSAVRQLAQRLQNSTERVGASEQRRSLMDPTTVSVFSDAITASGFPKVNSLEELAAEAWRISQKLAESQSGAQDQHSQQLERLRHFCVFLANGAIEQEQASREWQFPSRNWS